MPKINKIYIGQDQARPFEWKPNSHTVAYRPLNSNTTVNDQSGNSYNLTQTWWSFTTIDGVDCFYNGWSTTGYFTLTSWALIPSGSSDRTMSIRVRTTEATPAYNRYAVSYWWSSAWTSAWLYVSTSGKYEAYDHTTTIIWPTVTANTWVLLTYIVTWWKFYFYVNWQAQGNASTGSTTAISSSYPLRMGRRANSTSSSYQLRGYLSECIIEDQAWPATKVLNYFNWKKWSYGIS